MAVSFLEESLAVLTRTPATLDAMLRGLPVEWTAATEGPGTWSPYVVIGHLIHGEKADWMPRVVILLEHGTSRAFDNFDREAQFVESKGKSLPALLDEFATSPKPTREDREEMLDSLKEKYGALPKNELFAKGLEELVKAHQSEKPEPNRFANDKLAMAIIYRNPAEVRRWLAEGADPNLAAAGSSLLKLALLGRNEEIIGAMIEAGAKINSLEAVLLGDIPKLKALLVEGAKVDETDGQGMTLLHWAAGYGKSETVQALLECGANFNALSLQGSSSLLTAAFADHFNSVKLLREAGAKIGIWEAAALGELELLKEFLTQGADIEGAYEATMTPLMCASASGQSACVSYLLKSGADIRAETSISHKAFFFAVNRNRLEVIGLLLDNGVDVLEKFKHESELFNNSTILHHCMGIEVRMETLQLLLDRGADINAKSSNGYTPLVMAILTHNAHAVKFLLSAGANIEERDSRSRTPLLKAVSLDANEEIIRLLVENGADVNARDERGSAPLHGAATSGNKTTTELLLNAGAQIDAQDAGGATAITLASTLDHKEVAALLRARGAKEETIMDVMRELSAFNATKRLQPPREREFPE